MLMLQGIKLATIINLAIAGLTLCVSGYALYSANQAQQQVQAQTTHRMLYGSYMLGFDYEHLLLCAKGSKYARYEGCDNPTEVGDFARLEPLADVVLESPINWPALRGNVTIKGATEASDPLSPGSIVNAALSAHFINSNAADAFLLGQVNKFLLVLANDPATVSDKTQRSLYASLITNNAVKLSSDKFHLSDKFHQPCTASLEPATVSKKAVSGYTFCVYNSWMPPDY